MPFTTREIESPDPVTRVAAADAALRESGQDDIGEKMVLNMGPSHPATHGVLRLVLELDGEIITKATPDIGFLHRGDEKIAENMQYNQFVPYTDRLDYLAPLANNVAYALAVEKLMGWEIPPRGKAIRVDLLRNIARISSHLLGLGAMALDLGAMTVFLYTFTEREKLYNLFELLTGARFTTSPTPAWADKSAICPESFIPQLEKFLDDFRSESRRMRQAADPEQDFCRSHKRRRRHHEGARDRVCDFRAEPAREAESNTICAGNILISITTNTTSTWSSAAPAIVTIVIWCESRRCVRAREFCGRSIDKLPERSDQCFELEKHDCRRNRE